MGDTEKPYRWTVNYIGKEGFREYMSVESSDPLDLANRRVGTLKYLMDEGAESDVRKLFDGNGTKPGKLQSSDAPKQATDAPAAPSSKLARFAQPQPVEEKPTSQEPDKALEAMRASGFLTDAQADKVAESVGVKVEEKPKAAPTTAAASKLAKFQAKPAPAPAPAPTQAGPVSAPNVSPKLSKFVKPEQRKSE